MTKQASLKKKIRTRMEKTGERYAAARLALLGAPSNATVSMDGLLKGYRPFSSVHGDTARLCAALAHAGATAPHTGEPFSEAALFALTGGTGFMYFLFEYKGAPPMLTFVCRSWSMPWPLIQRAIDHAGLGTQIVETGSVKKAQTVLDQALDDGHVAHVTVDAASLPWTGSDPQWVGQVPRQANVVGRRGERYLIDDGLIREIDSATLQSARSACRKQKNRLVVFDGTVGASPEDMVDRSLAFTHGAFTDAPKKGFANNFGLKGLEKMANMMRDPKDKKGWAKVFDTPALCGLALRRVWACATLDYTPPAGGRPFYAEGLRALSTTKNAQRMEALAQLVEKSGAQFETLTERALRLGGPAVQKSAALSEEIDEFARSGNDPKRIGELKTQREAALDAMTHDEDARREAFTALSDDVTQILDAETAIAEAMAAA